MNFMQVFKEMQEIKGNARTCKEYARICKEYGGNARVFAPFIFIFQGNAQEMQGCARKCKEMQQNIRKWEDGKIY